jgi:hypothetical protein
MLEKWARRHYNSEIKRNPPLGGHYLAEVLLK